MHMTSRLKEFMIENMPNITSDTIKKLKKLNIDSVYQLAVQNPVELALEFEDTSFDVETDFCSHCKCSQELDRA